jgi:hypothetical protein
VATRYATTCRSFGSSISAVHIERTAHPVPTGRVSADQRHYVVRDRIERSTFRFRAGSQACAITHINVSPTLDAGRPAREADASEAGISLAFPTPSPFTSIRKWPTLTARPLLWHILAPLPLSWACFSGRFELLRGVEMRLSSDVRTGEYLWELPLSRLPIAIAEFCARRAARRSRSAIFTSSAASLPCCAKLLSGTG